MEKEEFPENNKDPNPEITDTTDQDFQAEVPKTENFSDTIPETTSNLETASESNFDPPLDGETHDPPKEKSFFSKVKNRLALTSAKQRFIATFVLLALVISSVAGILVYAGDKGTSNTLPTKSVTLSGGGCVGAVEYYPFYMITPIKLFPYMSKYSTGGRGAQVLVGADDDQNSVTLSDKSTYTLGKGEYYGNTIQGFSDGSLIMASNAYYTYSTSTTSHFGLATALEKGNAALKIHGEKKSFVGGELLASHIVTFEGTKVSTEVHVGTKDPYVQGIKNLKEENLQSHIFTAALVHETGDVYDSSKFSEVFNTSTKWKNVIKKVKNYKKLSFSLWEAISVVKDTSKGLELDPLTKITDYLSPTEKVSLHNNYDKGTFYSDMNNAQKQLVRYHELDLLMTLYVVALNNDYSSKNDSACASAWEEVINTYIRGWSDPTTSNSKKISTVYDTLAISPVIGFNSKGSYYMIPASEYLDASLGLPDNVSISSAKTANTFTVNTSNVKDADDYMLKLSNAALKAGKVTYDGCTAYQLGNGILGSKNLLQNVIGCYLDTPKTKTGVTQLNRANDSDEPWNSFEQFQLTTKTWGSNLIFLDGDTSTDTQKAIPQFSVSLSKDSSTETSTIAGTLDKVSCINNNPILDFHITASIGDNQDDKTLFSPFRVKIYGNHTSYML